MYYKRIIPGIVILSAIPFLFLSSAPRKTQLFLPNKKKEWHTYLSMSGINNDPKQVFTYIRDILHVSGEEFGYISTEKKYSNFHFTVEFIWGEKKFPPREKEKRDAGIMYHVDFYNGDKIWPRSLEYQIQEGDCGDFWMTDSTTIIFNDTLTPSRNAVRIKKSKDVERPKGQWNKAEVIVKDGNITHLLNGEVINTAKLGNTKTGTIVLQSEGAEIYYRNAEVEEFK